MTSDPDFTMQKTPGATSPVTYSTHGPLSKSRMPPSARGMSFVASSASGISRPCMPSTSIGMPVAFDRAVISSWVFVPSVNSVSMRGFIFLRSASSMLSSGMPCGMLTLFLPLPTHTTSRPRSWAYSTSLRHSTGSSPRMTVYTEPPALAIDDRRGPTVMSASTVMRATSVECVMHV